MALIAAGLAYVALVLFDDVEYPLLSLVFIVAVVYELRRPHRVWQRHPQRHRRSAIN
jgi:hypothetical protein